MSDSIAKKKPAGANPAAKASAKLLDFVTAYPEPGFVGELRAMGFRLLPIPAGEKSPPPTGYPTNGVDYLIPKGRNVAIDTEHFCDGHTPGGVSLLVVDVDCKDGKPGYESLTALQKKHGVLPATLTTITPTGGRHLFFTVAEPVRTFVGKDAESSLGAGIDVRSKSAYVIAPGSKVEAGTYRFEGQDNLPEGSVVRAGTYPPIAPAPQWLIDACGKPRERIDRPDEIQLTGYAAEVAYAKATRYLAQEAPVSVEGNGGDDCAYRVACRVRDFGVTQRECLDLMLEWNERCQPPWSSDELARKVANAYHYAGGTAGADNPAVVFEPVVGAVGAAAAKEVGPGLRVKLITAGTVRSKPIRWLWPEWLARGKLHVIAGAPGTGKTTIALSWAAAISAGSPFPNGETPKPGHVVIWSGEDGFEDTLRPRLAAAGADLSRVHFVDDVEQDGRRLPFDPARHVPALAAALSVLDDVAMIVVDPLVSAVSGDSHKNAEVRRGLAPLVDLADRLDAALVGITHYSKGTQGREPLERVSGSLAFGALARLVFGTVRQKSEGDDAARRYILLRVKSNIGPDGDGFGYTIEQCCAEAGIDASRIVWGDSIKGNARELLGDAEANENHDPAASDAVKFLREILADGPKPAKDIKRAAADDGYAWRTIQRARLRAGVKSDRGGFANGAVWSLAANEYQSAAEPFRDA